MILSSIVYVTLTLLSVVLFHTMMLKTVDNELRYFASSIGRAVDIRAGVPYFRDWARTVNTEPNKSIITIQLYDVNKRLLETYGPKGDAHLVLDSSSTQFAGKTFRVRTTEILQNKRLVGYLQLELSTEKAEDATRQFGLTIAMTAPLVIAGLALTALVVSGEVARPVMENVAMLRRFVADAGHELNTPLSIVQARIESVENKLSKQGVETDELKVVQRSLDRMNRIVRDLMFLTEVEGPLSSRAPNAAVDLSSIVSRTVEEFRDRYASKNIGLNFDAMPAMIQGYPDALQKLLTNLLENALRYTEAGGSVTVRLKQSEKQVLLVVEDTGIGIPRESLPLIFDRFYRVDKSRSRASGGVGLGLSIVKAIAEAHKGHVSVESAVGTGTKFIVTLPAIPA